MKARRVLTAAYWTVIGLAAATGIVAAAIVLTSPYAAAVGLITAVAVGSVGIACAPTNTRKGGRP